jgi:hypothetical protein
MINNMMRETMDFGRALPAGWSQLSEADRAESWAAFVRKFGELRPGIEQISWPAIVEPSPSITFDLGRGSKSIAARKDAVNAEALRCFVEEFEHDPLWVVLDWQHPGYCLDASVHASTRDTEWRVPVFPNGDYYTFSKFDFSEGTFGHPWEQTLCVFGPRLVETLGRTLSTWLPVKRVNGQPV